VSFRRLLDRTVTVVPRVVTGTGPRGNDVVEDGTPIVDVPAGRDLVDADETLRNRDQQRGEWIYFLPPATDDGTAITITGHDRIVDGDDVFEVEGPVDHVTRRRGGRLHHYEARVYRVEG